MRLHGDTCTNKVWSYSKAVQGRRGWDTDEPAVFLGLIVEGLKGLLEDLKELVLEDIFLRIFHLLWAQQ